MKKFVMVIILQFAVYSSFSCTNFIVTKGASKDGSCFLAYTNDAEYIYKLYYQPAKDYPEGEFLEITSDRNNVSGKIPQVRHTYATIGFHMNEHQLSIGETTATGRLELWNHSKFLEYWQLMQLALERAKNAREAIKVITELAEKYGYGSEAETFSIVDPNEAWVLEMCGTGNNGEGAIWVAMRVPDGHVCGHANSSVIGEFPLNDPENCMYSSNIISFAIEKGYYNPKSGKPFNYKEVYNPLKPATLRYCEARVWRMQSKAAPSLNLSSDYHRGKKGAKPYPFSVVPDKKLSLHEVFNFVRDYYEGTPFDMTQGIAAGPFNCPDICRPLQWTYEGKTYAWERPIAISNSAFTFVAQCRNWLPNEVGGIVWFGVDGAYFTCYTPIYCNNTEVPVWFTIGDINKFSWKSAWWIFNFVSNYANLRFCDMKVDIQKVQNQIETKLINQQPKIDSLIIGLNNKKAAADYLTYYTRQVADSIMNRWIELGEELMVKYNDGYVKNENKKITTPGYSNEWKKQVVKSDAAKYLLPVWDDKEKVDDKVKKDKQPY